MMDRFDINEHLYRCHVASLQTNVIPLGPQDYLVKPCENGLVISIGSLIFFKVFKANEIKKCHSADSFFSTLPGAKTVSYSKAKCRDISKRLTPIVVKCTLYSKYKQVSDTVVIRLNRCNIAGLREAHVETSGASSPPVKHRYTYCTNKRSTRGCGDKQTCLFSSLNRKISFKSRAESLEMQSCLVSPFFCNLYKRSSIRIFLKRLVKRLVKQQQRRNENYDESNATFVNESMKTCRFCKDWAPSKKLTMDVPLVIPIDCIVNFEPWQPLESIFSDLKLFCELYIDDSELATASATCRLFSNDANATISGVEAEMVQFYGETTFINSVHPQVPRQCCCKLKDMLLCSLHSSWMLEQASGLYKYVCKVKDDENCLLQRFLLYFFLQMTTFMQNKSLKMCTSHSIPNALMTIAIFTSRPTPSQNIDDYILEDAHRLVLSNIFNINGTRAFDEIYLKCKNERFKHPKALIVNLSLSNLDFDGFGSNFGFPVPCKYNFTPSITTSFLCKRGVEIMSQFADMFTINSTTLVFLPEPYDLTVLKRLIQRPMYDVHMKPKKEPLDANGVDPKANTSVGNDDSGSSFSASESLSFGSKKHKEINVLMWKYYGILCKSGRCLATFLRFVDWSDYKQAYDALLLLRLWSRPCIESLVELVSIDFCPPNVPNYVRRLLVDILKSRLTPKQVTQYTFQFIYSAIRRANYHGDPLYLWLLDCGTKHYETGVHLYWILKSACMNAKSGQAFIKVLKEFVLRLKVSNEAVAKHIMTCIKLQHSFKSEMVELKQLINVQWSGNASERTNLLVNHLLSNTHQWAKLEPFACKTREKQNEYLVRFGHDIPLLTDFSINIRGIYPRSCSVVRSNNTPLLLNLLTDAKDERIFLMFKTGEDIRQDQLCQQLVQVFNCILSRHGVDAHLLGYSVLPTGIKDGCVQFLSDSQSISAILKQYNGLEAYLAAHCNGPLELKQRKLNFIYSLAAYSVFTFVLGVGDRHHDNMLITKHGHLVHVDYTFAFGSDPKPLPAPPFRLSREMVDLMGGSRSKWYRQFKRRFFRIFVIIRLHAQFIIQLLYHSLNAHLQDLTLETIMKVESRFALAINDLEQLEQHVNKLVDSSCNALVPAVLERWHEWMLTWK